MTLRCPSKKPGLSDPDMLRDRPDLNLVDEAMGQYLAASDCSPTNCQRRQLQRRTGVRRGLRYRPVYYVARFIEK
jgi:hypothetical protein